MFIQLLKDGQAVLTAKTGHSIENDHYTFLPVNYAGDVSLVRKLHVEATPKLIYEDFFSAAGKHKLMLGGDFEQYIVRKSFTPPNKPSQKDLDSLGPEDIIY